LIVADDRAYSALSERLRGSSSGRDFEFHHTNSLSLAINSVRDRSYHVLVLDQSQVKVCLSSALSCVRATEPRLPIVLLGDPGDDVSALEELLSGAHDILPGAIDPFLFRRAVDNAVMNVSPAGVWSAVSYGQSPKAS